MSHEYNVGRRLFIIREIEIQKKRSKLKCKNCLSFSKCAIFTALGREVPNRNLSKIQLNPTKGVKQTFNEPNLKFWQ